MNGVATNKEKGNREVRQVFWIIQMASSAYKPVNVSWVSNVTQINSKEMNQLFCPFYLTSICLEVGKKIFSLSCMYFHG